jgi:hypothetical protein
MNLIKWARSGHERTLNQSIRPGLVIVVNKLAPGNDKWLDVNYATEELLNTYPPSGAFDDLRRKWATRGENLQTAEDVILRYYDSFRVVCIPDFVPSAYNSAAAMTPLVARQLKELDREIRTSSQRLRRKRLDVGMNLDVTSFTTYVEHAFNRLTKDLRAPIDFYYLESRDPTVPSRFSEHLTSVIIKLLSRYNYNHTNERKQEENLLSRLIPYLACCISLQIPSSAEASGEAMHG